MTYSCFPMLFLASRSLHRYFALNFLWFTGLSLSFVDDQNDCFGFYDT